MSAGRETKNPAKTPQSPRRAPTRRAVFFSLRRDVSMYRKEPRRRSSVSHLGRLNSSGQNPAKTPQSHAALLATNNYRVQPTRT